MSPREIADLSHSSSGDDDDDRIGCPEGSVPATPPLNPQLGCISGTVAAEPEAQLEDSEDVQSDDETDNVKDGEDHRSESLVVPLDQTSLEDEEEDNEEDEKDENNSDEVGNDKDGNNNGVR